MARHRGPDDITAIEALQMRSRTWLDLATNGNDQEAKITVICLEVAAYLLGKRFDKSLMTTKVRQGWNDNILDFIEEAVRRHVAADGKLGDLGTLFISEHAAARFESLEWEERIKRLRG